MKGRAVLAVLRLALATERWSDLCALLDGDFDNYDQLEDLSCSPLWGGCTGEHHDPLHSTIRRVDKLANLTAVLTGDGCVLYEEQYTNRDPQQILRQRLYVIEPDLSMSSHDFVNAAAFKGAALNPKLLNGLTTRELKMWPGCDVQWKWNQDLEKFQGSTPKTCRVVLNETVHVLAAELSLSKNLLTTHERLAPPVPGFNKALPNQLYRWRDAQLQQYTGFVYAVDPQNLTANVFQSNISLANNGQFQLLHAGTAGWFVEVAICHYSINETAADHSGAEVLKLAIYAQGARQAMTYAFVKPATPSMGLTYRDITSTTVIVQAEFKLADAAQPALAMV